MTASAAGSSGDSAPTLGLDDLRRRLGVPDVGGALHAMVQRLYPICRSITGDGVRRTLAIVHEQSPLTLHEVPTGTPVLDWIVPKEWNIRDAYVKDARGRRLIDFQQSSLHVVGYSVPVQARMTLAALRPKLYSLPEKPDWIPYRNSYYKEDWGFCLSDKVLQALLREDSGGEYEVVIDSTLADGNLTYGEAVLPGRTSDEVLVSCHVDHPSLANDNLSGITVGAWLARYLGTVSRRYTYRFVFLPVTIGSITWLARNEANLSRIRHGLVLSLLGDPGRITYKKSRRGDAPIDRAVAHVLAHAGADHALEEFMPYGYDERQYCSPGFDLPVGCLMRTPHGRYPEYHTSGDNPDLVKGSALEDSLGKLLAVVDLLEKDEVLLNTNPKGEPQLGRRGLYRALADRKDDGLDEMSILWTLNLSDGAHSLLDIAERARTPFARIWRAAQSLREHGLLVPPP